MYIYSAKLNLNTWFNYQILLNLCLLINPLGIYTNLSISIQTSRAIRCHISITRVKLAACSQTSFFNCQTIQTKYQFNRVRCKICEFVLINQHLANSVMLTNIQQPQNNINKMISKQLRTKAQDFLQCKRNANNLIDIIQMLEVMMEYVKWDGIYSNKGFLCKLWYGTSILYHNINVFDAKYKNYRSMG